MSNYKEDIIKKIKEYFSHKEIFTRKELYDFLELNFYPNLKKTTFRWRIYELKKTKLEAYYYWCKVFGLLSIEEK